MAKRRKANLIRAGAAGFQTRRQNAVDQPWECAPPKKPMLAAMTSKGVIACQHQSVVDCEWFQLVPEATKRTQ